MRKGILIHTFVSTFVVLFLAMPANGQSREHVESRLATEVEAILDGVLESAVELLRAGVDAGSEALTVFRSGTEGEPAAEAPVDVEEPSSIVEQPVPAEVFPQIDPNG